MSCLQSENIPVVPAKQQQILFGGVFAVDEVMYFFLDFLRQEVAEVFAKIKYSHLLRHTPDIQAFGVGDNIQKVVLWAKESEFADGIVQVEHLLVNCRQACRNLPEPRASSSSGLLVSETQINPSTEPEYKM